MALKPTKSNTADQGCAPVSSNCVIWQGPNISCINLCTGDTVSTVVYKLGVEICEMKNTLNLTDMDLTCLLEVCETTPEPAHTLAAILNLLKNKICCLSDAVKALQDSSGGAGTTPESISLPLPECLYYTDPATGQPVHALPEDSYITYLAQKICVLKASVTTNTSNIATLQTQVAALQAATGYTTPKMTPVCVLPSVETPIDQVLIALEKQYCDTIGKLGNLSAMSNAISSQCAGLTSANALSQNGTMGTIPGWNPSVVNLSNSIQNLWLTVCDMRAVIADLKACCGEVDCTQFILDYTATINRSTGSLNLIFTGITNIPTGYVNCPTKSTIIVKDSSGTSWTYTPFDLVATVPNTGGITLTVGGSLNPALDYTVKVIGCITKAGQVCSKETDKQLPAPCSNITGAVTATLL